MSTGLNDGYGEPAFDDDDDEPSTYYFNELLDDPEIVEQRNKLFKEEEEKKNRETPLWSELADFIRVLREIEYKAHTISHNFNIKVSYDVSDYNEEIESLNELKEKKTKTKKHMFTSLFSSIDRNIKLSEAFLEYFKTNLDPFFTNFNLFYESLIVIKRFITTYIGNDEEYETFIKRTITQRYKNYNLLEKLNYAMDELNKVYLIIRNNLNIKLEPITKNVDIYNFLNEYIDFFLRAKVQIDAYKFAIMNKSIYKYVKPPVTSRKDSVDYSKYSVGGKQSTKKIRRLAKVRHSLPKPTRGKKKNKARREKN